ncbi:hypothetical protein CVT24_001661 [Panaeolus cyanescens]|uniref:F-box domain-containing protein n=1 Tax=Panaeolus cyanescens TaxID=181874 RepID=A0A409VSZ7_9AGAR|nr:hypothetical protein CVT24_001661 [Panaeolus cyanescens]
MQSLAPEILDNITSYIPKSSETQTLNALSQTCRNLRHAANRKKFAKVDLSYSRLADDDANPGVPRFFEDGASLTYRFLKLISNPGSSDIPQHIRTITFSQVPKRHPPVPFHNADEDEDEEQEKYLIHYTPFSSIPIIISKAPNLKCIAFPATPRYDEAMNWGIDVPPILRNAFLNFYQSRGPQLYSKVDVTGLQFFPTDTLRSIPHIDELYVRPPVTGIAGVPNVQMDSDPEMREQDSTATDGSQAVAVAQTPPASMLKALGLEVPWGLMQRWEELVELMQPQSSFVDLSQLEKLQVSYYEENLAQINNLVQPCANTLRHLYLRVGSLTNGTTSTVDFDSNNIMQSHASPTPDLSTLQNLESITIVGLVYRTMSLRAYKTQAHWIAELLTSLVESPSFTTTLRSIHLCFALGRLLPGELYRLDWAPITQALGARFAQSNVDEIKFTFRMRDPKADTSTVLDDQMLVRVNNAQLRALQNATGVVSVSTHVDFNP